MQTLSAQLRESRRTAARNYSQQLQENEHALEYLIGERGLTPEMISRFGLGFVSEPSPEDHKFIGRISIPYLTRCPVRGASVVAMKFRSLDNGETPKYDTHPGNKRFLYNAGALLRDTDYICITEGEFDAISAEQAGLSCVGLPGAQRWKPRMARLFLGYSRVIVLSDNDEPGQQFAKAIAGDVPNLENITMPDDDVNTTLCLRGGDYIKEMVKV